MTEFIEPPPGIPRRTQASEPERGPVENPVVLPDSGTFRLPDRSERTPAPKPEIVFFPTVPGAPPAAPAVPVAPVTPGVVALPPVEGVSAVTLSEAPEQADAATVLSSSRHAAPAWRLVLPESRSFTIEATVFLGRDPVVPPGEIGHPLALVDPLKSVSKTHARLDVVDGALWVSDLHSTNGVWVVPPGAEAVRVEPGSRQAVPAGADLELGDFVIQVEHG